MSQDAVGVSKEARRHQRMLGPIIRAMVGRAGTAERLDEMKGVGPEPLEGDSRAGGGKRRAQVGGGGDRGQVVVDASSCPSRRKEDEQRGDSGCCWGG